MERYIALLRGINISGKNKISMSKLKECLIELGYTDVLTYLNSGNIIFTSALNDKNVLSNTIMLMIKEKFALDISVLVISQKELVEILEHVPYWWESGNKEIYNNLIFMIPPLSYNEFIEDIGPINEKYEQIYHYKDVIFWSFDRQNYRKTNWWSKTASSNISHKITIRTANTIRKIVNK